MTSKTELAGLLAKLAQALAEHEEPVKEPAVARPMPERVLLTVDEAAERLGIGRTLTFRLVKVGEIKSVTIGRLRRIPASAVSDYADRLVSQQRTGQAA
jgi:excisionase family DNA binding protein